MRTLAVLTLTWQSITFAQQQEVDLIAPAPALVPYVSSTIVGSQGATTYYYWIGVTYPVGKALPAGPFAVSNAPVLTTQTYVRLTWPVMPGALSYDVLRTSTPNLAMSGSCTCALATGVTSNTYSDQGGALSPYTIQSTGPARAALYLNNRDTANPQVIFLVNGVNAFGVDSAGNVNAVGPINAGSTVIDPTNGIKGPIVACVGTPGNTVGPYRSLCITAAGAIYACGNANGCNVVGDWIASASGTVPTCATSSLPVYAFYNGSPVGISALAAHQNNLFKFHNNQPCSFTRYGFRIDATGLTSGQGFAFALYDSTGTNGQPGNLVANSTANFSTTGVTNTAEAVPMGGTVTLAANTDYYLAFAADNITALITMANDNMTSKVNPIMNLATAPSTVSCANVTTGTGGSIIFPATCGAITLQTNNIFPLIWLLN